MKKRFCTAALLAAVCVLSGCSSSSGQMNAAGTGAPVSASTATLPQQQSVQETSTAEESAAASSEPETTEPAAVSDEEWKAAYREVLRQYQDTQDEETTDSFSLVKWDLQDLDQDGIPELLVSEGEFHVAGVLYYAYRDGKAQQLLTGEGEPLRYGVYGEVLICPEEKLLSVSNMHMGYSYTVLHRYEDGKLIPVLSFSEDSGAVGEENVTYTVNDETVTREAYDAALAESNARQWEVVGRQYDLEDLSPLE